MQRQLDRLVKSLGDVDTSAGQAFVKAPPKIDAVTKSLGAAKFQTANLAAQFQDIAVQLQGGTSPFTVALQQGTQISQVLGQAGAGGVVKLLGTAFASLVSPVSLATIGVIAFGGAAVQWGAKAIGAIDDLDERMKAHVALVKSLKEVYGDAAKGVDTSTKESAAVLRALLNISTDKLQKDFARLAQSAAAPGQQMAQFVDDFGRIIETGADKFAPFRKAIDDFNASVRAGKPDVQTFRDSISETVNSSADQKVRSLGGELLDASKNAGELANSLRSVGEAGKGLDTAALAAAAMNKNFADALKTLGGTVSKNLSDREKIEQNFSKVMQSANSDPKQMAAMAERDNQLAILSYNERKKAAEEAGKAAESATKRFQGQLDSVQKRNAQLFGAQSGVGQGVEQLAKLEVQYRLTEAAQQAFGKVTPEIAAKIDAVAASAGRAADALAKAKLQSDIGFDRSQIGLSPAEQSANSRLRSVFGDDVNSAQAQFYKQQLLVNDALRQYSDIGKDATKGFISDIVAGKSALEALSGALTKISNKLLDMAVDSLWGKAFGGSGGLLSLLGGGGGGASGLMQVGNQLFPKFANGTNFAPGGLSIVGERGPELVNLPRGSQVLPASATANALGQGGGTTISYSIDARGADSGTVARIQTVLAQHAKAIAGQGRVMQSAQRYQATGVS